LRDDDLSIAKKFEERWCLESRKEMLLNGGKSRRECSGGRIVRHAVLAAAVAPDGQGAGRNRMHAVRGRGV